MIRPRVAALAAGLLLAGCGSVTPRETTPVQSAASGAPPPPSAALAPPTSLPPGPARVVPRAIAPPQPEIPLLPASGMTARAVGVSAGPPVAELGITMAEAQAALAGFIRSCPALLRRADASGLTTSTDWQAACAAAPGWPAGDPLGFFTRYFETAIVGDGRAFATGYYEPEIRGSRTRRAGYNVPIYRRPPDLIDVDLGQFVPDLKGRSIRGQVQGTKLGLYPDRARIVGGALAGRGLELAWGVDPIEVFFLQVQGSGLLRLPDGGVMRVGYATENGRGYTGIGKYIRDNGLLQPGDAQSMQGIMAVLRRQPDGGAAIMDANKSFVFFREIGGPGPIGALGVPVAARVSVAADPKFVPLGAPIFLYLDRGEASGLWVAQDTGGAIKGANRVDTYWGSGADARTIAGGMSGRGQAWLLVPIGTVARAGEGMDGGAPAQP